MKIWTSMSIKVGELQGFKTDNLPAPAISLLSSIMEAVKWFAVIGSCACTGEIPLSKYFSKKPAELIQKDDSKFLDFVWIVCLQIACQINSKKSNKCSWNFPKMNQKHQQNYPTNLSNLKGFSLSKNFVKFSLPSLKFQLLAGFF